MNASIEPIGPHRQEAGIDVARGFYAVLCFAAIGFLAPILLIFSLAIGRWIVDGSNERDRPNLVSRQAGETLIFPVLGTMAVLSAAGWATFAPRRKNRFAATLAIIFAFSVLAWFVLGAMELTPKRIKSIQHPIIYLSEIVILVLPPLIAGFSLAATRNENMRSETVERHEI
jgi:hypothetical protein